MKNFRTDQIGYHLLLMNANDLLSDFLLTNWGGEKKSDVSQLEVNLRNRRF